MIDFANTYIELGGEFFQRIAPTPVTNPDLIAFNQELAGELGIAHDPDDVAGLAQIFSGNRVPAGAAPLAMAYNGHQFGQFNPDLGDGRAILLGQVRSAAGQQNDIQLKGSGPTRYSRNGDGRSALGPVIREYLLSEAMHHLGVPTTRALAAVTTGEKVYRESIKPGGILARVSVSFVRVGTFEYFAYRGDTKSIRKLADYSIRTNYPELADGEQPYIALLDAVVDRQAALIARWMNLGFIHGVMNTDNMSIAGETIDYGPCAFMDDFAHDRVYSSIDRNGRYAFDQQPNIGLWNLTRLAETLLPLLSDGETKAVDIANQCLERYVSTYQQYWLDGMREKMGLVESVDDDQDLADALLGIMAANEADFTLTFRRLSQLSDTADDRDARLLEQFKTTAKISGWLASWRVRLQREHQDEISRKQRMSRVNPVYIPRNHQVEAAISAAEVNDDFSVFQALNEVLKQPFEKQHGKDVYMRPPEEHEVVHQTFCGT